MRALRLHLWSATALAAVVVFFVGLLLLSRGAQAGRASQRPLSSWSPASALRNGKSNAHSTGASASWSASSQLVGSRPELSEDDRTRLTSVLARPARTLLARIEDPGRKGRGMAMIRATASPTMAGYAALA